jgi:peptidoglycan hydrolase CwlO-like protein
MSRQIINNTTVNPDTLKVAMDKSNSNFSELYSAVTGTTVVTKTSDLTNDGANGVNPFITIQDVPTTIAISGVTGLSAALSQIQSDVQGNTDDIVSLNATISTLTGIINTQNGQIATMQADIADLYNIINNL